MTYQAVLSEMDAAHNSGIYRNETDMFRRVNQALGPAYLTYVTNGNNNSDVGNMLGAVVYARSKYWPGNYSGGADGAPERFYADQLWWRLKDDTTLSQMQSDAKAWVNDWSNGSHGGPGTGGSLGGLPTGLPQVGTSVGAGVSAVTTPVVDAVTSVVTSLPDAVANIGKVLNAMYDVLRWFTSPSHLWRVAKFLLGAVMIVLGGMAIVKDTSVGKALTGMAGPVGKAVAMAA